MHRIDRTVLPNRLIHFDICDVRKILLQKRISVIRVFFGIQISCVLIALSQRLHLRNLVILNIVFKRRLNGDFLHLDLEFLLGRRLLQGIRNIFNID